MSPPLDIYWDIGKHRSNSLRRSRAFTSLLPTVPRSCTVMDHPPPAPEAEPPAHHPAPPGGQQHPPQTIPDILLADLTGTAYGSVVLTSTQCGVWGRVVRGLQDDDREIRKGKRRVSKAQFLVQDNRELQPKDEVKDMFSMVGKKSKPFFEDEQIYDENAQDSSKGIDDAEEDLEA